jgi:succinyl-CoA:(S)-malate CoA-transferase subunit A
MSVTRKRPLEGYRVLDLATMVAAPFCGSILGEFGAEVIKVEMPGKGDPLRMFGERSATGSSYNWLSEARNRKGVTLDLRVPRGVELAKRLVARSDIVLENFRPGTLEKWGLGLEAMRGVNRDVILVSVSAYGQDGPYRDRPGYARIAHGFSGLSHLTGEPDGAPAVPGASALADYIAGLYAAIGALLALVGRDRFGEGQQVDVSLYEGIFRMLDDLAPTYARNGTVRDRLGADSTSAVPHSNYRTADGKWVALACSNDKMFERLTEVMGRRDLLERFAHVDARLACRAEVNGIVSNWAARFTQDEMILLGEQGDVPLGRINTIADIFEDVHVRARGNLLSLDVEWEGPVVVPGVFPHLRDTPGRVDSLGPRLGEQNVQVYGELLGLGPDEMAALHEQKVI